MPKHDLRNLEQAKAMLDYFLETDLSKLTLPPNTSKHNNFAVSSSGSAPQTPSTPPPQTPLNP